ARARSPPSAMSAGAAESAAAAGPRILIVDDDRRILELLEIAFTAHGFRVLTAPDGEQATKLTLTERPDVVVLDIRLPKKSGLEVCEWLRKDPDDPLIPILMLSAMTDTETRLQAFTRGADDYLVKPFSPKELIARVKRLLARSADAREAHLRRVEFEREAHRATEETRRTQTAALHEQRVHSLATGLGLDLLGTLDENELMERLLPIARARLGAGIAGLLLRERDECGLEPAGVRGDAFERLAGLELPPGGPLATLLAGLERPVLRRDLERHSDLRPELAPLAAAGIVLLVPLRGPAGLEALLVADERRDGAAYPPIELELLTRLAPLAGTAFANARRARLQAANALDAMVPVAGARPGCPCAEHVSAARFRDEARAIVARAARATLLPPRQRRLLEHALRLGGCAPAALGADDPTGSGRDLAGLLARIEAPAVIETLAPEDARAAALLAAGLAYAAGRERGLECDAALACACETAGVRLDPITRQALEGAAREQEMLAR
ncbi:MAG TPA: response regulator, partial [Terriglobales bacterium]|nr:response regulator [Terriglobales bacterium]